jgi:hypothetical protein
MNEIFRTRDCTVHFKGDAYPVAVDPALIAAGWPGGQGVMWDDSPLDEFRVKQSDGIYGGFLLWGSEETSDQLTASSGNQLAYGYAILCSGGWIASFNTYERYTWDSRHGIGPPNVPLVYNVGERLVFSNRGWFTNETGPNSEWTKTLDPRGDNVFYVAYVIQEPRADNEWRLVLQTAI